MAYVPKAVQTYFDRHSAEQVPVERFRDLFDITWASRERFAGSESSFYLLKPKKHTAEIYGFERELMLIFSPYSALEPRILAQAKEVEERAQLRNRIEPLYLVVIAPIEDIDVEVGRFSQDAEVRRILVGFDEKELRDNLDPWLLRKRFSEALFSRDLFDMKQALVDDSYFFGRQAFVLDLLDRVKRGENCGVYGLRKTGKTSALFKLRRLIEADNAGLMIYLDAQSPSISRLRWWELLSVIKDQAAQAAGIELKHPLDRPFTERTVMSRMKGALGAILDHPNRGARRLLIVIDEIEHLAPELMGGSHWEEDFLPFWKFLRALQTEDRRIAFLVAGVNPSVAERPSVLKQDNPLFSLLGIRYLPPFSSHEAKDMVQTLGKRMGILFDSAACDYLCSRYGGHPMLIRLACSWEHRRQAIAGFTERPVRFELEQLMQSEEERELALLYYTRHVLDVLKQWYPDEYELLGMLSRGESAGFREFAEQTPESVEHLRAYGLLKAQGDELAIAIVGSYLQMQERAESRANDRAPQTMALEEPAQDGMTLPVSASELLATGESDRVEYKSTLRKNLFSGKNDVAIELAVLKTIAAFLNSGGGHLLVGVDDTGKPLGLDHDDFQSEDKLMLHLVNLIKDRIGAQHSACISGRFEEIDGKRVLIVACAASGKAVYVRDGQAEQFFVRLLGATIELKPSQISQFLAQRLRSVSKP